MSRILSGRKLKNEKIPEQQRRVQALKDKGITPKLCIVTVGDDEASAVYVRNKIRLAETLGIAVHHEIVRGECSQEKLNGIMRIAGTAFHAVILQLPLPVGLNADEAASYIPASADVDGFQPQSPYVQCTARGVVEMLRSVHPNLRGKSAVVIGRSEKVGLPIAMALLREDMSVTICHSKTDIGDMNRFLAHSDVVVSCVGKPKFFHWSRTNAHSVIIDVGMNRDQDGKLCGDFDTEGINIGSAIRTYTPVPGGVGQMTVSCLMDNVLEAAERSVNP